MAEEGFGMQQLNFSLCDLAAPPDFFKESSEDKLQIYKLRNTSFGYLMSIIVENLQEKITVVYSRR
jgi:hypothetical protein